MFFFTQHLQALVQLDPAEVFAERKRQSADSPRALWEDDAFDGAFGERGGSYHLEALRELHALQTRAPKERGRFDYLQRRRDSDVLYSTIRKHHSPGLFFSAVPFLSEHFQTFVQLDTAQ